MYAKRRRHCRRPHSDGPSIYFIIGVRGLIFVLQRSFVVHSKDDITAVGYKLVGPANVLPNERVWEVKGLSQDMVVPEKVMADERLFVTDRDQNIQVSRKISGYRQ